ncbi:MAG TPA: acetylhydrolase [Sedimentibacter sp.]|nr:acetylhydrolase [Sedimentibacter sp.]
MGLFVIIMVLIFEVAFIFYCIKTKDNQIKSKSRFSIAGFIIFVGATLSSIIGWSFQWYLLGFLLFIFAIIGGIRLISKKVVRKPYKRWRVVLRGIVMIFILAVVTIPTIVFPQYDVPEMSGEFKVKTSTYTFTDTNRIETFTDTGENRKITVEFWYPEKTDEKYPLIVFSHGAFGVKVSNTSTFMELASNGYVVCSIDHPYHAAGTVDTDGKLTLGSSKFMEEVIDANSDIYSEEEQFELFKNWMSLRTDDINFVLDTILKNSGNSSEEVYGVIDTNKIGLMGHSLGGAASSQLGREREDISAVINIDGSMLGEYSINKNGEPLINNEPFPIPLLNFYSEYVINELIADPEFVYPNKYISSISPTAFEVCIKGSNHMSYTDLPLFSPLLANQLSGISGGSSKATVDKYYCIETMNKLVLEFFNSYVKNEGSFSSKEYY